MLRKEREEEEKDVRVFPIYYFIFQMRCNAKDEDNNLMKEVAAPHMHGRLKKKQIRFLIRQPSVNKNEMRQGRSGDSSCGWIEIFSPLSHTIKRFQHLP